MAFKMKFSGFKSVDLVEGTKDVEEAKKSLVEAKMKTPEAPDSPSPNKFIPHPLAPIIGAWKMGKALITGKPPETFAGKLGKKVGAKIKNYITRKKLEGFEAARSEKLGKKYIPSSKSK